MGFLEPWLHAMSRVTQSRAQDALTQQQGNGKQAPDVLDNSRTVHAVLSNNNCAVHTMPTTTHTRGLSWKAYNITCRHQDNVPTMRASPSGSVEVATKHDLFPDIVSGAVEETRNSSQGNLDDDEVKGSEGIQSRHVDGSVKAGSSACRLRREVDEGSRDVSSSDEEKVTADRVRVGHRNGRVQVRESVCVFETKSVTGRTPEVRATSVRQFFVWSGSSRNNSVKTLEVDRPTECINPFSQRTTGVGEARDCWQIPSSPFRFSQG